MRRAIVAGAVVLLAATGICFVPFLASERPVHAATVTPPPLFERAKIRLRAGERLCVRPVVLVTDAEVVRVLGRTGGGAGARLHVEASAPGYRATGSAVARGPDGTPIDVPITPPDRDVEGEVCLTASAPLALGATTEARSSSRAVSFVDGREVEPDVVLSFLERRPATLAGRAGEVVRRASAFRPDPIGPWTFWLLGPLAALGIPAGLLWALAATLRSTDR